MPEQRIQNNVGSTLEDIPYREVIHAIEEYAVDGCKVWRAWPRLELHEEADILWTASDVPFAVFNSVLWARLAPADVEARIEERLALARSQNVPLMWWIGPSTEPADLGKYLRSMGLAPAGNTTGMAADLLAMDDIRPKPRGLSIQEALDEEALQVWSRVMGPVFDFPEFAAHAWFEMHAAVGLGLGKPWRHYVGWLDGQAVATSSLFFGEGVAGIANVATLPDARGRGIGTAMTLALMNEARQHRYRIAALCSSEMGLRVYRQLGFQEYCQMRMYVWMKA